MRKLTHYELRILIKNEVQNMQINALEQGGPDIGYIHARCEDILKYAEEYWNLVENDNEK